MDWLDDDGAGASVEYSTAVEAHARRWPTNVVPALSVVAIAIALWSWFSEKPVVALSTYVVLLIAGCGLLWYQRFTAISASRQAGGSGVLVIAPAEKAALAALVLGCVANGVVIAVWIARMVG